MKSFVYVISLCFVTGIESALLNKQEGEKCKRVGDEDWICQTLINCPQINVRNNRPDICSFKEKDPIICCPPSKAESLESSFNNGDNTKSKEKESFENTAAVETTNKPPEISSGMSPGTPPLAVMKCIQYEVNLCQNLINNDNIRKNRTIRNVAASSVELNFRHEVVGGQQAVDTFQFSFMVAIGFGEEPHVSFECEGTVISEIWVLGAAHCAQSNLGKAKWVGLSSVMMEPDLIGLSIPIKQIVVHPSYKAPALYNDIALFQLKTFIVFNPYTHPTCLHPLKVLPRYSTAVGYRANNFGDGKKSLNLFYDDMMTVDSKSCKQIYNTSRFLPRGFDDEIMFCADGKKKGTSIGGGPLFYNSSICLRIQLGIFSFKHNQGTYPGLYTRINHYVPWIESIIWPNVKVDSLL